MVPSRIGSPAAVWMRPARIATTLLGWAAAPFARRSAGGAGPSLGVFAAARAAVGLNGAGRSSGVRSANPPAWYAQSRFTERSNTLRPSMYVSSTCV